MVLLTARYKHNARFLQYLLYPTSANLTITSHILYSAPRALFRH